jgi:membrane protease YdiL (CAAX protease family)
VAVAATYIVISTSAVGTLNADFLFPAEWSSVERTTGSGFLIGALFQVLLVLSAAYLFGLKELQRSIAASSAASTSKAWIIAAIATAIHIGTAILVFLPRPERLWELSGLNLTLSAVSAPDGWSQEVLFRGYVLYRLARGDVPPLAQILISGALFAAIHHGYTRLSVRFEWKADIPCLFPTDHICQDNLTRTRDQLCQVLLTYTFRYRGGFDALHACYEWPTRPIGCRGADLHSR